MMYLLELSGLDEGGKPDVKSFGGNFLSIDAAEAHGRLAADTYPFDFRPLTLWVRDQANEVVLQVAI